MKADLEKAPTLHDSGLHLPNPASGEMASQDDLEGTSQSTSSQNAVRFEQVQNAFGPAFVDIAYRAILGREPSSVESEYWLGELRNGSAKFQLIAALRKSPEGKAYSRQPHDSSWARHIGTEIAQFRLRRIPLIGRILGWALRLEGNSDLDRSLRSVEYRLFDLARQYEALVNCDRRFSRNFPDAAERAEVASTSEVAVRERADVTTETIDALGTSTDLTPDRAKGDYWLPQGLRDFIIDCYGECHIPIFTYWMELIDGFGNNHGDFENSPEFASLLARLRRQAATVALSSSKPSVSIIVPVYNALVYTLTCISSILEFSGNVVLEILVGDDGSTDATAETVSSIGECVRVVTQPSNLGFLGNCNSTARHARGDIVVFLNNDTLVLPGWLEALIAPLSSPDVGMSGAKLINPDGTLQEAGGIVWRDGSAWNYGRGQDPRLPEFNYLKEADYISGASIALRATTWQDLGGFDPHYSPAYCEDTDLAFRIRAQGLRVMYQPRSALIHHEGRSHGRDTTSGIKAYQVTNGKKFVERWRRTLEGDHFANGEHVFVARDRSRYKPHILFIDHYVPQWDRDAGSRTMLHYLKLFVAAGFHVTLWPDNLHEDVEYVRRLQEMGIEVIYSAAYIDQFDTWIKLNSHWINYVYSSRPHITVKYLPAIKAHTKAKILYYGHDLHFLRLIKEYLITRNGTSLKEAMVSCGLELKICTNVDAALYPGFEERQILKAMLGSNANPIAVIPVYLFDQGEFALAEGRLSRLDRRKRRNLMFVGGFSHSPNVDGVLWFVRDVMPLLQKVAPDFILNIAGSNTPDAIQLLASDRIRVLGRISDEKLARLYDEAGAAIIPLRYGAGVKGKVIEAMAAAIPIVSTSVGVQGINGSEDFVFLGDTPAAFVEAVLAADSDTELVRRKVAAGIKFLRETHSIEAAKTILAPLVPQFGARPSNASTFARE